MTHLRTIDALQNEYNELLQKIRPSEHFYRFATERQDDGSPHVEIVEKEYHVVSTERGLDLSRKRFATKAEVLYDLIALDTFWMGADFEFKNRIENRDVRRLIFAKQIELLNRANPLWANRRQNEIDAILTQSPFSDDL